MNQILSWLKVHPLWNVIIVFIYYLLVVLPHEWVGVTIAGLFEGQSRLYYNNVILGVSLLIALIVIIPHLKRLLNHPKQRLGWIYLLSLVSLITFAFNTIIIVNIELIHIIQYAVFAILIFPLMNGYTVTLLLTSLVGGIDEGYQYFYLSPQRTNYYDLNDVVFNTLGGACGLLWLWTGQYPTSYRKVSEILKSWQWLCVLASVTTVALLILVGKVAYFPTEGIEALWTLVRKVPDGFWTSIDNNTIVFHVSLPLEGLFYCIILWVLYGTMDFTSRAKS